MEDHPLMFVIMAIYGALMIVWYSIKAIWLILGIIILAIKWVFKKNTNKSEVDNNVIG